MIHKEGEARSVIVALRGYRDRINEILGALETKNTLDPDERATLQGWLTSLKSDLKAAAKFGTIGGGRTPQNQFESAYFEPAVRSAAANLTVAVNSHPIGSNWYSCLYGVRLDITHLLHQLETQFPGA